MVEPIDELVDEYQVICGRDWMRYGLQTISPRLYPAYLESDDGQPTLFVLSAECIFCDALGGDNIKPSYWPN